MAMKKAVTAPYFTADGKAGEARPLPKDPFDGVVHETAVHAAISSYLANQRQGTASAKNRRVITGGGRKPWRQKGTGRARVGSIRSPIWRGGAVVFPPVPRSYRQELPKKVRRLARRSAFNARAAEGQVILIEGFTLEQPKTRTLFQLLQKLGVGGRKVLILTDGQRPVLQLSARNIPEVEVRPYGNESTYDLLWSNAVIIEDSALTGAAVEKKTVKAAGKTSEASGDA